MPFQRKLLGWDAQGIEPPQSLKTAGWAAQQKPPADYFNWAFHFIDQGLYELQQNAIHKEVIGKANGVAKLGADGKVLNADGTKAGEVTKKQFDDHAVLMASKTQIGHTQLSSFVTSEAEDRAATSKAVKIAYDRADAAFTSAGNGKTAIKNAITGADSRVIVPTDPSFVELAIAVSQIQTGKKFAVGNVTASGGYDLTVTGLNFKPRLILIGIIGSESSALAHTFWSNDLDPTRGYLGGTNEPYKLSSLGHYVSTGGFKLKRHFASTQSAFWIAYE